MLTPEEILHRYTTEKDLTEEQIRAKYNSKSLKREYQIELITDDYVSFENELNELLNKHTKITQVPVKEYRWEYLPKRI